MNGILPQIPVPVETHYKCQKCGHEFKKTSFKRPWPYAPDIIMAFLCKPRCKKCKSRKVKTTGQSVIVG